MLQPLSGLIEVALDPQRSQLLRLVIPEACEHGIEAFAVLGLLEVSTIVIADAMPLTLMVNVSLPSVKKSLAKLIEIVVTPLAFTTAVPLIKLPVTSDGLMPVREYGTAVPAATLLVFNVKTTVAPSFTDVLLAVSE